MSGSVSGAIAMPKAKGTPGGNPDPVRNGRFQSAKDVEEGVEMAGNPTCVKLPITLDVIVRSLPDRSAWLRAAILEKLKRDGLIANLQAEPSRSKQMKCFQHEERKWDTITSDLPVSVLAVRGWNLITKAKYREIRKKSREENKASGK